MNTKIKVLLVTTSLDGSSGGIGTNNNNLLQALTESYNVEVHNLALDNNGTPLYKKLQLLVRLIFTFRVNMVIFDHVHLARVSLVFPKIYLLKKSIILAHGSESYFGMKPIDRYIYKNCQTVLCNSNLTRIRHIAWGGRSAAIACPLGASREKVPSEFSGKTIDTKFKLLIVARVDKREGKKGHFELLQALAELPSNMMLTIVGHGSGLNDLKKKSEDSALMDRVNFLGKVSEQELKRIYAEHHLFVMPSRQEGFGLVFVEAMSWGLPAIGCDCDAAEEIITDRKTGRLISSRISIDQLVMAINDIHGDYFRYSRNARDRYQSDFSFEAYKNRLLNAISFNHNETSGTRE